MHGVIDKLGVASSQCPAELAMNPEVKPDMTHTAAAAQPGSEFHSFLFALIGEDSNGLPLSVISALARMDLDPWEEAALLSGLPAERALQKVVAMLRSLPNLTLNDPDRGTLATRLISLLPRKDASGSRRPAVPVSAGDAPQSRFGVGALVFAIFMFVLMATQFVMARFEPPTQGKPADAPTSIATPSRTAPASAVNGTAG